VQRTQSSPKQGPNVVGWDESRPARTAGTLVVGTGGATVLLLAASNRGAGDLDPLAALPSTLPAAHPHQARSVEPEPDRNAAKIGRSGKVLNCGNGSLRASKLSGIVVSRT
jgi:hypothetical protein